MILKQDKPPSIDGMFGRWVPMALMQKKIRGVDVYWSSIFSPFQLQPLRKL